MRGVGIDLVEVNRFAGFLERQRERVLKRVFTPAEWEESLRHGHAAQSLAARFAAKEAAMKALGLNMFRCGWCDIEVVRGGEGAPRVRLSGRAEERARVEGITSLYVSLTHTTTTAAAVVVAE